MTQYRNLSGLPRSEVERLLDAGVVWAEMKSGRYWRIRRNGKTITWKTRPNDYRIPVKAGLRVYAYIEDTQDKTNLQHWMTDALEATQ